jgi:hypothetical protein
LRILCTAPADVADVTDVGFQNFPVIIFDDLSDSSIGVRDIENNSDIPDS